MTTIRLTMAQALVRYLAAQSSERKGKEVPLFAGVFAIFGHGNVAGMGEALHAEQKRLPTYRSHNEQAMAHAAAAFAKATCRRQIMACTSSIGPGATNMITAAAAAHVNRVPILLLPGDIYANRRPDPVLQQVEDFGDGTVSANDCFRPVSRYFDRVTRPEQILNALPRALAVLTDPSECGPVTLSLCQDVQAEAYDYPESFFEPHVWRLRRARPDERELADAARALKAAKKPLIIAGGGVLFSEASETLAAFAETHGIPVCETMAGKSSLPEKHPLNMGGVGVTGTSAANELAAEADVILAVGTRLQDFTTGSWSLFQGKGRRLIGLNTQVFDATKHFALPLVADAQVGLDALSITIGAHKTPAAWTKQAAEGKAKWMTDHGRATASTNEKLPSDAQVIGGVLRGSKSSDILVAAAGGLPGELHRLWQAQEPGGYHAEYGYSTMGYEIAGALGVKLAEPKREVFVMLGDGSYLMMNSEIATSVMMGQKLIICVLDNSGFACINRLQRATGGESFNNLLETAYHVTMPKIDFVMHARSLGAEAVKVDSIPALETALEKARKSTKTSVVVIDTDALKTSGIGGTWWDVAVPEVSTRPEVVAARKTYEKKKELQRVGE